MTSDARPFLRSARMQIAVALLAGLALGAVSAWFVARQQFDEQLVLAREAAELRVQAATQRVHEVEEQQRETIQQADAHERQLIDQSLQQQLALLARESARESRLAKPDLPLRVWMRAPIPGARLIARVHNFGTRELALTVTVKRSSTGEHASWNLPLAPNATQDMGEAPGWMFSPEDDIDFVASDYRPANFHVPLRSLQLPRPDAHN